LGNGSSGVLVNPNPGYVNTSNKFVSISAGYFHSCGLLENGSAMCWGDNGNGEWENGGLSNQANPLEYIM